MSAEEKSDEANVVEMRRGEQKRPDDGTPAPEEATAPRGGLRRRVILMVALPLILVLAGGYYWITGGRYIETDNAYLQQDKVVITADVSGRIVEVAVKDGDSVKKGDLLFRIDPEPYRLTLSQAQAAVASARLSVDQLRSAYQQALAARKTAADELDFQKKSFARQQELFNKGVASSADFDSKQNSLHAAEQSLAGADEKVQGALAALGGDPSIATEKHPAVLQAQAAVDQAKLNYDRTSAYAPSDGRVAQAGKLLVGQYVTSPVSNPTALLTLVSSNASWVEANFKETDLTNLRTGQAATVTIDAYPGREMKAKVISIGAGTGSQFSLLPAQNATGNWVKVVQRVPVKVAIENAPADLAMRTGLSAFVSVDTGHSRGLFGLGAAAAQ